MICHQCGAYIQPISRFCARCGAANAEYVALFPPKVKLNNHNLLYLQKLIVYNSPDKLVFTKDQLIKSAYPVIQRDLEICRDCTELINSTANPEVFFPRWDLLYETLLFLLKLEPFISFTTGTPSQSLVDLCQSENRSCKDFIERFYQKIAGMTNQLKTAKGKHNKLNTFVEKLEPFFYRMSKENYQYITTLFFEAVSAVENDQPVRRLENAGIKPVCKNYDINSVAGIRQIPYNDFSVMYELQRCATAHKRNGDLFLAIECLKKSNQISDSQPNLRERLSSKGYLRVLSYIKLLGNKDMLESEEAVIRNRHPEFWDKRVSNRWYIQEELAKNKHFNNDLVTVHVNKTCPICSQFGNIVFSISGRDRRYPRLPDIIINQTHNCTQHYMSLLMYLEGITTHPNK